PKEAGVSVEVIKHFSGRVPLLGVCLGHQCIAHAYGGAVTYAKTLMHGKTSPVTHDSLGVFTDIPSPFTATRYHSLAVDALKLPNCLEVTATTDDGEIMGIRHKDFPVQGVQFHPESILSEHGHQLLRNFLDQR
ncbi:MAG: aminodeoxychorismate/anthranilate synthase component II, partial [Halieaceae bacterium]